MRISDWSSDVCSSDLPARRYRHGGEAQHHALLYDRLSPGRRRDQLCDGAQRLYARGDRRPPLGRCRGGVSALGATAPVCPEEPLSEVEVASRRTRAVLRDGASKSSTPPPPARGRRNRLPLPHPLNPTFSKR